MVQWLTRLPCKPGVASLILGFSKNLLVEPSGAPGTTNSQKTTSYSTGLAKEKKKMFNDLLEAGTEIYLQPLLPFNIWTGFGNLK